MVSTLFVPMYSTSFHLSNYLPIFFEVTATMRTGEACILEVLFPESCSVSK